MGRATLPAPLVTLVDVDGSPDSSAQRQAAAEPALRHPRPWTAPDAELPRRDIGPGTADEPPRDTEPDRLVISVIQRARLAGPAVPPEEIVDCPTVRALAAVATPAQGGGR